MATAPTSRRLNLTRDQLATFLTDQQQIRQFELLFATVDQIQVITGTDFEYQADTAAATANEALAQLSALAQDTAVTNAVLEAKIQQAIDAIPRLAQALELLAAAPVIENNNSVATDYIDFNTNAPAPAVKVGRLHWNGGYTLNLEMTPNVNQAIGESQYYYIKASATIAKGQLVMFDGSVGASGVLKGKPSTGITNGQLIMGVAAEAIANNGFGLVSNFGLVRGFNTTGAPYGETWADGDILYYNPSVAGGLSKNIPAAPTPHVVVAAVVNAATAGSGSVFVRVQAEPLVGQLSDVYAPTPVAGDVLIYDATQQRWESARLTAGTNVSITNADGSITINSSNSGGTVTSVAALTLGTTGTDLSSTVANGTTTPVITLNVPTASASNRGALSSTDWSTFNGKQAALFSGTNIKTVNGTSLLGSGDLGTITVPYGGTGLTSLTANYIPIGNGTGALSSTAQFQFDGTGLRIGNNAADSAGLDVIKGGGFNYIAKFKNTSSASGYGVAFEEPSGAAAGYPTLIVYSFAGASTWFRIDTGGGTYFSNVTTTAAAANAVIDTGTGYQLKRSTSSARFKRDIENIDLASSANVFKLRPIWYRSKANDDNQNWSWYGLLAEEVAEVEPRLVQWGYAPEDYNTEYDVSKTTEEDENGDLVEREVKHPRQVLKPGATMRPDGVMYDRLSVMLLAEMKKLRQEFDEYKATHP
jgi:hypothetical protein